MAPRGADCFSFALVVNAYTYQIVRAITFRLIDSTVTRKSHVSFIGNVVEVGVNTDFAADYRPLKSVGDLGV